jgi:hypothetical protein
MVQVNMCFIVVLCAVVCAQIGVTGSQQAATTAPAELSIEAGVLLRSGDIKRVARTPVVLLNADFGEKLLQVRPKGLRNVQLQAAAYLASKRYLEMARKPLTSDVLQMDDFLNASTVATAVTDFDGKATISVPPGEYFVFSVFELADKYIVWSVPVHLKAGTNAIVLDQNNIR